MKFMIASDIHGSYYWAAKLAEAYAREGADRLILLGDLLYHGPRNPLPDEYNPMRVAELLNGMKNELFCVRGNCDADIDQAVLEFPIMADYALLSVGENIAFVTHGHIWNEDNRPAFKAGDFLIHGHTHVPMRREHGKFTYLNPGSAALPKMDSWHGYMTLEDGVFTWKDMEGAVHTGLGDVDFS